MNRRTILKGGVVIAATSHTATAPAVASAEPDLTWEQFADVDFEPWGKDLLTSLPSNSEWINALTTVRLTSGMLVQTKEQVIEAMRSLSNEQNDDGENLAQVFIESMISTREMMQAMLSVIECGIARSANAVFNT